MSASPRDQLVNELPEERRSMDAPIIDALIKEAHAASPTAQERSRLDARFRSMLAQHIDRRSTTSRASWLQQTLSGLLGVAVASAAWALVFVRTLPQAQVPPSTETLALTQHVRVPLLDQEEDAQPTDTKQRAVQPSAASKLGVNQLGPRAFDDSLQGSNVALQKQADIPAVHEQASGMTSGATAAPPVTTDPFLAGGGLPGAALGARREDADTLAQDAAMESRGSTISTSNAYLGEIPKGIPNELAVYQITNEVPPQMNASAYTTLTPETSLRLLLDTIQNAEVRGPKLTYTELRLGENLFFVPSYEFTITDRVSGTTSLRSLSAVHGIELPFAQ